MSTGAGLFVSFEGGEGAGKSTQIRRLADHLRRRGFSTSSPPVNRAVPPAPKRCAMCFCPAPPNPSASAWRRCFFAAARNDHVETVICPAAGQGFCRCAIVSWIPPDVYQGVTGNLEAEFIDALELIAVNGVIPNMTLILDLPAATGLARGRLAAEGRRSLARPLRA